MVVSMGVDMAEVSVTDAGCVVVPSQHEANSPALYHIHVGVTDGTTIFCLWTMVLYAFSLTSSGAPFPFLFKKPMVLLAFFTLFVVDMCVPF